MKNKHLNIKQYTRLEVIWRDIVQLSGEWTDGEKMDEKEHDIEGTSIHSSIGHYISSSDCYLHIAQNLSKDRKSFGEVICIPFGCIEKITELTENLKFRVISTKIN